MFPATIFIRACICCILVLALSGCDTARNLWGQTTDLYETYIDPKPEIDLQRRDGVSRQEKRLAMLFSVMDQQLELLLRTMAPQDSFPSPAWFDKVSGRYPWLTATLAVDAQGAILARRPEIPIKTVQVAALLDREWSIMERGLQGFVQDTPLGPEFIVAGPFFRDGEWQGLLVAHFDPRSLISQVEDADDLVLFTPGQLMWSGLDPETTRALIDAPWEDILKSRVQGRWSSGEALFVWISRPIGALQMIYAVAVD